MCIKVKTANKIYLNVVGFFYYLFIFTMLIFDPKVKNGFDKNETKARYVLLSV